jgi:uncharacterized protein (TIGR02266 family)
LSKDRRKHPRIQAILLVEFGSDAFPLEEAETENYSLGGLFIITEDPLTPGDRIPIRISLPDDPVPIMADCEVVWLRPKSKDEPSGMGVKFEEIEPHDLARLDTLTQVMGDFLKPH